MFLHPRSKNRPYHLGPFPLETLPRDESLIAQEAERPRTAAPESSESTAELARVADRYRAVFEGFAEGDAAAARAELPDDLERRSIDIKGSAYFLDASQVGICRLPESAWLAGVEPLPHDHAVVLLVEKPALPEAGSPARALIEPAAEAIPAMRAAEIAACLAGHIRAMGYAARADLHDARKLDWARLAVLAGLAVRRGGRILNPFLDDVFVLGVVSTDLPLTTDLPLHADALKAKGLAYWWGIGGAQSGRERRRRAKRASHLSRYPMEQVKRIERPTTLILDEEVPRVPKRAAFFQRALHGDLGEKSKTERSRFAFKTPLSFSMLQLIRAMVPRQDGELGEGEGGFGDPATNARTLKSLSYVLGSDLTGICEIPRYAWFSHHEDGREIEPYHRYAVVMLIDQGFDTMEGASGDDWISGSQSMRSYLRGAEIAGVMAEFLRGRGIPARPQTNAVSDVLHIPLVLWAGLGELSRIGELVLNPFVGPRFKSVVLTTDLPLEVDRPIDFGLQTFCGNCLKCARECPCDAIPFGDKVMFNGYEMWKPDVERCTRYRLTNVKGSACGRCMKTCPINKVIDADGALLTRMASWLGVNAMWLKPIMVPLATRLDDWLGNGRRNAAKKWWLDLELVEGAAVAPPKGTNQRDLDPARVVDPAKQKMAYYPADSMPPPDREAAVPLDRKAALAAKDQLETPDQAKRRSDAGEAPPEHYRPTPPEGAESGKPRKIANPYR